MKCAKSFWLMIIFLLMLSPHIFSQVVEEKETPAIPETAEGKEPSAEALLTLDETRATARILKQFESTLIETGDIEIALRDVAAKDYYERTYDFFCKKYKDIGFGIIDDTLLRNNHAEFRRGYYALLNFVYLAPINYFLQKSDQEETEQDENDLFRYFPLDVQQTLLNNPTFRQMLKSDSRTNEEKEEQKIESFSIYLGLVICTENANDLLRRHAADFRSQNPEIFMSVLAKENQAISASPRLHICNEECALLPDGTRTIVAEYLMYQFTLIKVKDEWKIVYVTPRLDD